MKKHFLFALATLSLVACTNLSNLQKASVSQPIQPIHLVSDTVHLFLTDYVPSLNEQDIDRLLFQGVEYNNIAPEMDLVCAPADEKEGNLVSSLIVENKGKRLYIPALPNLEHKQALVTLAQTDQSVTFGFLNSPVRPHFTLYWQNIELIEPNLEQDEAGNFTLNLSQLPKKYSHKGRSFIRIYAADDQYLYNDLLIVLQDGKPITQTAQLTRHDNQAQVLYSLMIDRFENGNPTNDRKLNEPDVLDIVDYQGGDFAGITKKIKEGFFDQLGITTLWISPITQNPNDAWGYYNFNGQICKYKDIHGQVPDFTKFSGYHGYWPIYVTKTDDRFGTDAELRYLLATAHEHNINVILDYVANHVHINSPILHEHPDWITDSILPDGRRNFELWDEQRLTTWFDIHIPSLDLQRPEVYEPMTDSALYWLENFDFDGFRHDACKHIPECYWRAFTHKIKTRFPDRPIWMIGETYGDPALISSYVKTGMLDAQFDFNIYHTAIDVFGRNRSMRDLARVIEESLATYGAHHTMGCISGNHDKARFISLAGGALSWDEDPKEAGWMREVGVGDATVAYKKALLLEVLNLTIPGVPCIYQGDEYAQAGANDPDNRHMMRFDGYDEQESQFLSEVKRLIEFRRNHLCMMYGEYIPLEVDDNLLVFERIYMGQKVVVAINKSEQAQYVAALESNIEPLSYLVEER